MQETPEISTEFKYVERDVVKRLPKVVLHDHLDGGLRPATLIELADAAGYDKLPTTDADELAQWFAEAADSGSLERYLEPFAHTCAVMQTKEALERVAREAVEDVAADSGVYAEFRIAPEQHLSGGLSLQEVVDALVSGLRAGEAATGCVSRLLLCAMRDAGRAEEIAQLVVDNYDDGIVVGFDIAGAEAGNLPDDHAAAFALLRENFIPFTIHAGEAAGEESLRSALLQGARRLGHGVRLYEDFSVDLDGIHTGRVSGFVRDARIALELCPTSNLQTGVVDEIGDHPLPLFQQLGFTCTLNTDNRLVSGVTMTDEMMLLVDVFDYGIEELFELTINAIENAFIPIAQRTELLQTRILPAYQELEATEEQ